MLLFKKKKSFLTTKNTATKIRRPAISKYPFLKSLKRRSNFRLQKLRISLMQRTLRYKVRPVNLLPVRSMQYLMNSKFRYGTKAQLSSYLGRRNIQSRQNLSRVVLRNFPYVLRENFNHSNLFFSFQRITKPQESTLLINNSRWSVPIYALWESLNLNSGWKVSGKSYGSLTGASLYCTTSPNLISASSLITSNITAKPSLEEASVVQPNSVNGLGLFESPVYENLNYSPPIYANLKKVLGRFHSLKLFNNRQKTSLRRKYVFASTWTSTFGVLDRFSYTRGVFLKKRVPVSTTLTTKRFVKYVPKLMRGTSVYKRPNKLNLLNGLISSKGHHAIPSTNNKGLSLKVTSWTKLARVSLLKKGSLSIDTQRRTVPHQLQRRPPLTQTSVRNMYHLLTQLRDSSKTLKGLRKQYFRSRRRQRRFTFLIRRIKRQGLRRNKLLRFFYRTSRQLPRFRKVKSQKVTSRKEGVKWLPESFRLTLVSRRLTLYPETSKSTLNLKFLQGPSSQRGLLKRGNPVSVFHFSPQLTISRLILRPFLTLNYSSCEPLLRYFFSPLPLDTRGGNIHTRVKAPTPSTANSLITIAGIQNQLQAYFFTCHQPNLRLSNLWTAPTSHYTLRKRLLRFLSTASFQVEITQWYYLSLTRFIEHCTGRKVALRFGPFVDDCLTFEERALSSTWLNRLMGFKKRLGHRIFIKESLSVILASLKLKDPTLLANWIRAMLKRISFWKYRLIFRFLKFLILHLLRPHFWKLNIRGFKLRLKGKISVAGNARTRTLFYRVGDTSHSKIKNRIAYDLSLVNTFTGVMGLKVWFIY